MKILISILVLSLMLLSFSGCNVGAGTNTSSGAGGTGTGGGTGAGGGMTITGAADNWQFAGAVGGREIGAALQLTQGTITGVGHIFDNGSPECFSFDQSYFLSGTIDPDGNTSMKSTLHNGGVLKLTGVLDSQRSNLSLGSYSFEGGCADGDHGSLTGTKIQPVIGTYKGTLEIESATLTQSADLGGNGFLNVAGKVIYHNLTCSKEFTVASSQIAGRFIQMSLVADDKSTTTAYGNISTDAKQLDLVDYDDCGGRGLLVRQ